MTIASIPLGALLGVFLLGVLTQQAARGRGHGGRGGGAGRDALRALLRRRIAWTWYVLIGTVVTFGVGLAASLFEKPIAEQRDSEHDN